MKEKIKKIVGLSVIFSFIVLFSFLIIFICLIGAVAGDSGKSDASSIGVVDIGASGIYEAAVESYREKVTEYCTTYDNKKCKKICGGLPQYVNAVLALMTIESHGSGTDPMQASEGAYNTKYPKVPNGIKDVDYSIQCGVQEFRDAIVMANVSSPTDYGKLGVAIQGYNFGARRWLEWINKNGGKYTVELATKYSNEEMPAGAKGTPTHAQKFLEVYKKAITVQNAQGDISVNTENVQDIISLKEARAWLLVTNNKYSNKPPWGSYTDAARSKLCTTISIKTWTFKKDKGTSLKTINRSLTVNTALKNYYITFFEDVYKAKICIATLGCYGHAGNVNAASPTYSGHAFGISLDINENYNPNGVSPPTKKEWKKLSARKRLVTFYDGCPLVEIADKYTMQWGGRFKNTKDAMHFSYVGDGTRQ